MHPLLIEYYERFNREKPPKIERFWTQLDSQTYGENLPYLFDIENFCIRLAQAFLNHEKVCIYSDYDTDAVTATAVMYWGLRDLGFSKENLNFYAPDRFTEGYGMNAESAQKLTEENDLIISVDCGINSTEEAEIIASSKKCDLIITDHHHLSGGIPDAVSVINPRLRNMYQTKPELKKKFKKNTEKLINNNEHEYFLQNWIKDIKPENYVSESVTGVGVAWFSLVWLNYFWQDFAETNTEIIKPKVISLNRLLPLVAIGTVADCQSILEPQNRLLVRTGLQILGQDRHGIPGLSELTKQIGAKEKLKQGYRLNSQDLGFIYSPILNSSGRVSHAQLSISAMIEDNSNEVKKLVGDLINTNTERKQMVRDILGEVEKNAENQIKENRSIIWLEGDWNKGIIGLLASRLVNQHNLPCVVVSKEENKSGGSLRAPEGYHLPEAMKQTEELFEKFGGHPGAAGFTTTQGNLKEIRENLEKNLEKQAKKIISDDISFSNNMQKLPSQIQELSAKKHLIWIKPKEIKNEILEEIWNLDPFGQDFPLPKFIFSLSNFEMKWLGGAKSHAKIAFEKKQTVTIFNLKEEEQKTLDSLFRRSITEQIKSNNGFQKIESETEFWIEAKPAQNTWNGKTTTELIAERIWFI